MSFDIYINLDAVYLESGGQIMDQSILFVPVLLPIVAGLAMLLIKDEKKEYRPILIETVVIITSIIMWVIILTGMGRGEVRKRSLESKPQ